MFDHASSANLSVRSESSKEIEFSDVEFDNGEDASEFEPLETSPTSPTSPGKKASATHNPNGRGRVDGPEIEPMMAEANEFPDDFDQEAHDFNNQLVESRPSTGDRPAEFI